MHVSLLKPFKDMAQYKGPTLPNDDGKEEYEIESILAHRSTKGGQRKFLVKWKGYTFEECTWEPEKNFKSHTIRDYDERRKASKDEESTSDEEDTVAAMACVEPRRSERGQYTQQEETSQEGSSYTERTDGMSS